MERKLLNLLGFFISTIIFSFSVHSLVTKQYQRTVIEETSTENSFKAPGTSGVPGAPSSSGTAEKVSVRGISDDSLIDHETTPKPSPPPTSEANSSRVTAQSENIEVESVDDDQGGEEKNREDSFISVPLTIDYGDGRVDGFDSEIGSDTSVYDYLKSVATVEVSEYSFGVFVESINGIGSDSSTGRYWLYEVNGEKPNVGADQYKLSNGDAIRWVYTEI